MIFPRGISHAWCQPHSTTLNCRARGSTPRPDGVTLTRNVGLSRRHKATQIVRVEIRTCALKLCERSSPVAHPTLQRRRIITTYASLQKHQRASDIHSFVMKTLASRRANRDVFYVQFR
jgi:hypothetical protein